MQPTLKSANTTTRTIFILVGIIVIAIAALLAVLRLSSRRPVAPTAPESQPSAATTACTTTFVVAAPTATRTPTPSNTPPPGATSTPTRTPTPAVFSIGSKCVNNTGIALEWNNYGAINYQVERCSGFVCNYTVLATVTTLNYTDTTAAPNQQYTYRVGARRALLAPNDIDSLVYSNSINATYNCFTPTNTPPPGASLTPTNTPAPGASLTPTFTPTPTLAVSPTPTALPVAGSLTTTLGVVLGGVLLVALAVVFAL